MCMPVGRLPGPVAATNFGCGQYRYLNLSTRSGNGEAGLASEKALVLCLSSSLKSWLDYLARRTIFSSFLQAISTDPSQKRSIWLRSLPSRRDQAI
ncbi:hypothetical protein DOTSEDRAFT_72032 [Dothistroma septosporum NZE10]|uniref:Uncharacterized protein n=1 Tax=Dothistroma septosporum (strain NZE10 / CBS 128990) TaxID=675120 RepID=N1PPP9_DOTSN|nr:hypothetical protein DOTSEDRAFT_72032 [Dothistroma septosporum NZE10]